MDNLGVLQECGLTESEAVVYLALLREGPSSVLDVSRATALKRPTIYLILDSLLRQGFSALVPGEKRKLFIALPPERFEEEVERRRSMIHAALPELSATYRSRTERPIVRFFESKEGILGVYRGIAREPDLREILSFVSLEAIPEEFTEAYEIFSRIYKKRDVAGREIISSDNLNPPYLEKLKGLPNYEFRLAKAKHPFLTDNVIYGRKMATFSFKKRFALVIESEDVVASWRSLFEMAWEEAGR